MVTLRPRDSRIAAREAAAIPLPREDTTPPVTNTNLVIAEGAERHVREIQIIPQTGLTPGIFRMTHPPSTSLAAIPAGAGPVSTPATRFSAGKRIATSRTSAHPPHPAGHEFHCRAKPATSSGRTARL